MTIKTATEYLKRFYSQTDTDEVTLKEVFSIYGFNPHKEKINRVWIGNKLIYLKRYQLVEPVYDGDKANARLIAIKLTDEGRKVLNSENDYSINQLQNKVSSRDLKAITLNDVVQAMPRIRQENPEYEINFDFRLRSV